MTDMSKPDYAAADQAQVEINNIDHEHSRCGSGPAADCNRHVHNRTDLVDELDFHLRRGRYTP